MPRWNDEIAARLRDLDLEPTVEADVVSEIAQHLDNRYAALRAEGFDAAAARAGALDELRDEQLLRRELIDHQPRTSVALLLASPLARSWPGGLPQEARWAWRNLRSRGWRPLVAVAVLAVALVANTLMFAAADSLVFRRAPYPDLDRLVEMRQLDVKSGQPGSAFVSPALLEAWRQQADLVAAVEGHLSKAIFLTSVGEPRMVPTADVTVGLPDLLGVRPRWGRGFLPEDARPSDADAVLLAESLARELFGDPAAAVGQRLETSARPVAVVGVMPATFRFPGDEQRIWRALDPRGPLAEGFVGVWSIARLTPETDLQRASPILEQRSAAIGRAAGARAGYAARPVAVYPSAPLGAQRRVFLMLLSAAACVLLAACANVASLQLADALTRARTMAIQLAIGASRASLVRTAILEGIFLVALAALLAAALSLPGAAALGRYLPDPLTRASVNPLDLDPRSLLFLAGLAVVAALLSSLPVVIYAGRANLLDLLKAEGSALATSRASKRFRQALTIAEVAVAVMMLVGTLLSVRSYMSLLRIEKGFDSTDVLAIELTVPPQSLTFAAERRALTDTLLSRIRSRPGVLGAFQGSPPPNTGESPTAIRELEVDDRAPEPTDLAFPKLRVERDYFTVLRIPLLQGRFLEDDDPPFNVLISQALAARLWPGQNAVGHRFREAPDRPWFHVTGIVGDVRARLTTIGAPEREYQFYSARRESYRAPDRRPEPANRLRQSSPAVFR